MLGDQLGFAEDLQKPMVPIWVGALDIPCGFSYQLATCGGVSYVAGRALHCQGSVSKLRTLLAAHFPHSSGGGVGVGEGDGKSGPRTSPNTVAEKHGSAVACGTDCLQGRRAEAVEAERDALLVQAAEMRRTIDHLRAQLGAASSHTLSVGGGAGGEEGAGGEDA